MFVLIGEGYDVGQECIGGPWRDFPFENRIALFDKKEDARKWAESFRLKTEKRLSFSAPQVFKAKSPMARYVSYRIEDETPEVLPINPHLEK